MIAKEKEGDMGMGKLPSVPSYPVQLPPALRATNDSRIGGGTREKGNGNGMKGEPLGHQSSKKSYALMSNVQWAG